MIARKNNFLIALFFSLLACSGYHNQLIAQNSLNITVCDTYGQYIKNADVFVIESDGTKNKGKYDRKESHYSFFKKITTGTLILKHKKYQQETYQLEDIIPYYASQSVRLFLREKQHGFYSSRKIRYPYVKQPNRIGLAILDAQKGRLLEKELLNEGLVSSSFLVEKKEKKRRKNQITYGTTSFDIRVYKIPETLDSIARSRISKILFLHDQSIPSGPLIGESILKRAIILRPIHPKTSLEIQKIIESKGILFSIESLDSNQHKIRLDSFSAEEILRWIDVINEMEEFHPICIQTVSPVFYH